jgi:hypothetical protein
MLRLRESVIKNSITVTVITVCIVTIISVVAWQGILAAQSVSHGQDISVNTRLYADAVQAGIIYRTADQNAVLSAIIERKQRFYADTFPELTFIVIQGGASSAEDLEALSVLLGPEPVSLDYEHPPQLREDLMYVSLERIRIMLESNTPSASLIRADDPAGQNDKICIITINPTAIATDDLTATHYLIEPYYQIRGKIKDEKLVDRKSFLEFVFDHEVYHCLESNFIGPQPMSHREFWADYYHYRHENAADAFAIAMHIMNHQAVTEFVTQMIAIRGLSLYCDDCNHWTPRIIQHVANTDPVALISKDTMALFRYASSLRDTIAPGYNDYLLYRSAAREVCRILKSELWNTGEESTLPSPEPEIVNSMLDIFRNSYLQLTGTEFSLDATR